MDTPSPQSVSQPPYVQCQCRHCRRRGWGIIGGFFRFIGLLVVLALVFVAGLVIGGFGPVGMLPFGHDVLWQGDGARMMLKGGVREFNMKFGQDDRHFGVVTAISGQKVTIADNGGGTQTVAVSADTIVMDGDREVPMWTLRRGNSLRIFGSTKDAVISARLIEVIR